MALLRLEVDDEEKGAEEREKPVVRTSDGRSPSSIVAVSQSKGASSGLKGCREPVRLLSTCCLSLSGDISSGIRSPRSGGSSAYSSVLSAAEEYCRRWKEMVAT